MVPPRPSVIQKAPKKFSGFILNSKWWIKPVNEFPHFLLFRWSCMPWCLSCILNSEKLILDSHRSLIDQNQQLCYHLFHVLFYNDLFPKSCIWFSNVLTLARFRELAPASSSLKIVRYSLYVYNWRKTCRAYSWKTKSYM